MLTGFTYCPHCEEGFEAEIEMTEFGELYDSQQATCPNCNTVMNIEAELEVNVVSTTLVTKGTIFCKECNFEQDHCECENASG